MRAGFVGSPSLPSYPSGPTARKVRSGEVEHVPLVQAAGRVAAEMVSPHPPGLPRILPGERINEAQVTYLAEGRQAGLFAMDPSDLSLETVRVVA